MKKITNKDRFYLFIITIVFSLLLLSYCVFKNNNDTKSYEQEIAETQNDAALIVEIANLNLTTLHLLNHTIINEFNGDKEKLKSFKKINNELKFDINTIAIKKLISIPNEYEVVDNLNPESSYTFTQVELETALKEQLDLFTRLQQSTSDKEILAFSINSKEKLTKI